VDNHLSWFFGVKKNNLQKSFTKVNSICK
jgi:hypothetical protein